VKKNRKKFCSRKKKSQIFIKARSPSIILFYSSHSLIQAFKNSSWSKSKAPQEFLLLATSYHIIGLQLFVYIYRNIFWNFPISQEGWRFQTSFWNL